MAAIPITLALQFSIGAGSAYKTLGKVGKSFETLGDNLQQTIQHINNINKIHGPLAGGFVMVANKMDAYNLKVWNTAQNMARYTQVADEFAAIMVNEVNDSLSKGVEGFTNLTKALGLSGSKWTVEGEKMQEVMMKVREQFGPKTLGQVTTTLNDIGKSAKNLSEKDLLKLLELSQDLKQAMDFGEAKDVVKITKEMDKLAKKAKEAGEATKGIGGALRSLFSFIPDIGMLYGGVTAIQDAFNAQKDTVHAMVQMGQITTDQLGTITFDIANLGESAASIGQHWNTAWKAMDQVNKQTEIMLRVGTKTSEKMEEVSRVMNELRRMRLPVDQLEGLTTTSIQMSQAFGMSLGQANEFIKTLSLIGGLSEKEIKSAADGIATVQANLGLSSQEAGEVTTQVGFMVNRMRAFGGTVKDIQGLTQSVGKLVARFKSVGLEAAQANEILNKMLDPSKIDENIMMYTGLGYSMQEVFNIMKGDTKALADMDERMYKLAQQLQTQFGHHPIALQEMAKQYGISVDMVQKLGRMTPEQFAQQQKQVTLEEQANKARLNAMQSLQKVWNQLNILMQKFILPLINFLTPILTTIVDTAIAFVSWLEKIPFVGGIIIKVLGAILLLLAVKMTGALLGGVLPAFGKIGAAVGGLFGKLGGLIKGPLSKLGGVFGKIFGKGADAINKTTSAVSKTTESISKVGDQASKAKGGGFFESLSKVSPAHLVALGFAIFQIAAGIALIVAAMALLATTMKELDIAQIVGLVLVMAVVMGGMVGVLIAFTAALTALGPVAAVVGPLLIPLGFAILLIAAGVALVVLSIAVLVLAFSQMTDPVILLGMAAMLGFLIALIFILPALVVPANAVAPALFLIGLAFLLMGAGAMLAGIGIMLIVKAFILLGENIGVVGAGISAFGGAILGLLPSLFLFGLAAVAMLGASISILAALGIMMMAIPMLIILGMVSGGVATNFYKMGLGVKYVAEHTQTAVSMLDLLKAKLDELNKTDFSSHFVAEVQRISAAIAQLALLSPLMAMVSLFLPKQAAPEPTAGPGTTEGENNPMNKIAENTGRSANALEQILVILKGSPAKITKNDGGGGDVVAL